MTLRNRSLFAIDAVMLLVGTFVAMTIRYEGIAPLLSHLPEKVPYLLLTVPVRLGVLWIAGSYRRLWRYANAADLARLAGAGGIAAFANIVLGIVVLPLTGLMGARVSLMTLSLDAAMTIGLPALLRLTQRDIDRRQSRRGRIASGPGKPVLIAGAGAAGRVVVTQLLENHGLRLRPVGFLDDDREKHGQLLVNVPVLGSLDALEEVVRCTGAVELIVAMPNATGESIRAIAASARRLGLATRTIPALSDLVSGRVSVSALRNLEIGDLLRREPIRTDMAAVRAIARHRRILITGAGGSIGRELCRQIAELDPGRIALLGHGENSIFEIQGEMRRRWPDIRCDALICDVRDAERLDQLFAWFRPEVVLHAAAHKHVPLMENNPVEAITNNILGTRNVAAAAVKYGVQRFVMISTDKAVRPTSVMGASKRVAEQLVQQLAERHGMNFSAVRFGNVLGSRGSVVPIFLEQIRNGGPITITHPEVRRYFMTIPEAVQLVLQAAAMGVGGEVFALDMGEPVRIVDLATDLIRLSGLEPERDIRVVFTGLRPGEKLTEEIFFDEESAEPTTHPEVLVSRMMPLPEGLESEVDTLADLAMNGADRDAIRRAMQQLVPDYAAADLEALPASAYRLRAVA